MFCQSAEELTALELHARKLSEGVFDVSVSPSHTFEMYVVAAEVLMSMSDLSPHEQLLEDGSLVVFDDRKGNAMFVSHQWAGSDHPDPNLEQFRVLQDALRHILHPGCNTRFHAGCVVCG